MKSKLAATLSALALASSTLMTPRVARAQQSDPLAEADAAYAQVDFELARTKAQQAIDRGGYSRAQLARAYFLLGIALAALGEEAASRDAFSRMIALAPDSRAERGLSPRLRAPLLEARGLWTARGQSMDVRVELDATRRNLVITTSDPLQMGHALRVRTRAGGSWSEQRRQPVASTLSVPVQGGDRGAIECVVTLVDAAGNELASSGSEARPVLFAAPRVESLPTQTTAARPSLVMPGAIVTGAGVAVGAFAGIGFALREASAARWNDDDRCLPWSGATRAQTCSADRQSAETWQTVAIASTVLASVAVATGVGLVLASPRGEERAPSRVACDLAPWTDGAQVFCGLRGF